MTDENFDKRMEDWAARAVEAAPELRPTAEMYKLVEASGVRTRVFWRQPRWALTAGAALAVIIVMIIGGLLIGDPTAWFKPAPDQQVAFIEQRAGPAPHIDTPAKGKGSEHLFQQLTLQIHHAAGETIESLDLRTLPTKPVAITTSDVFRLLARPAQPRYLYIYIVNPGGNYLALHPERGFNPLHPLVTTPLPAQPDWFYLSGEPGMYRLVLVTADSRLSELDAKYREYRQQLDSRDYESAQNALNADLESIVSDSAVDLAVWELTIILQD